MYPGFKKAKYQHDLSARGCVHDRLHDRASEFPRPHVSVRSAALLKTKDY